MWGEHHQLSIIPYRMFLPTLLLDLLTLTTIATSKSHQLVVPGLADGQQELKLYGYKQLRMQTVSAKHV